MLYDNKCYGETEKENLMTGSIGWGDSTILKEQSGIGLNEKMIRLRTEEARYT